MGNILIDTLSGGDGKVKIEFTSSSPGIMVLKSDPKTHINVTSEDTFTDSSGVVRKRIFYD